MPYIQASTGWITKAEARMFIHGCNRPVNEVRAHAYQGLRGPNTVEPHLGLDQSLGQVCIDFFARVEALCVQVLHKSP